MTIKKTDAETSARAASTDINRRKFLTSTVTAVGGAMVLGFWLPPRNAAAMQTAPAQPWYRDALVPEINAWITIAPDNTVTIRVGQTEMGTGVFTNCPMMVAEELQCDWTKVRAEYASANRNLREKAPEWTLKVPGNGASDPAGGGDPAMLGNANGVYRRTATNSSGSVREGRYYLQLAGAEARERLLLAAAATWRVPVSELVAKDSVITHVKSKQRTTYGALAARAAQIQLSDPSKIKLKTPDTFTLMGTEQKDRTVPLKVTGQATYTSDIRLPSMLYAASKACPVWGGKVKSYDFNAIKNRPGVHSVVPFGGPGAADPRIGHVSGGVAVVADSWWRAQTALDALPIEWDYGPNVSVASASLLENHLESTKDAGEVRTEVGNVNTAMGAAARIIEATYSVPYVGHSRMEPGASTAIVTADRVDVWTGDQMPEDALQAAAQEAGLAPEKVYVHMTFIGGGYGHGGNTGANQQAVAVAKTLNGRPVKLIWKREEDWGYGLRPRPMGVGVFKAGLDAAGWPIAIEVRTSGTPYAGAQQWRGLHQPPYFLPNYRYTTHLPKSHVPVLFRRATGSSTNCFYLESFIDELAHAAGRDPYLYRRELIARNPAAPKLGVGGFERAEVWLKALDMAAKMSGWGTPLPEGWARGIAIDDRRMQGRTQTCIVAEVLTVEVTRRGQVKLHRVDVAHEQGFTFVNPLSVRKQVEGQMAWGFDDALHHAVTVKDGRAVETNFDSLAMSRMAEYPKQVNISFFKSNHWIYGVGEESIPQVAPAIANAVFKITGRRIRSLPLKNHDLSWGA
jgi:isoquinoline 1-oxidoreductase beta subunit